MIAGRAPLQPHTGGSSLGISGVRGERSVAMQARRVAKALLLNRPRDADVLRPPRRHVHLAFPGAQLNSSGSEINLFD